MRVTNMSWLKLMYPPPGSFAGPYASLLFAWNKTFTLALFSVLALVGACFNLRLPETKGIPTPNSAEEVGTSAALSITAVILQARKRLTFSPGLCSSFYLFRFKDVQGERLQWLSMLERTPWPVIVYRLVVLGPILAVWKDQEKDMFSDLSFLRCI